MKFLQLKYLVIFLFTLNLYKAYSHDKLSHDDELRLQKIIQFIKKNLVYQPLVRVPCTDVALTTQLNSGKITIATWVKEIYRLYDYDAETCLNQLIEPKSTTKEAILIANFAKICYANEHGDSKTAIELGLTLLPQSRDFPILTAAVYQMLGRSYHVNEEYEVSFIHFENAIKIARQIQDADIETLAWVGLMGVSREIFQHDLTRVNVYAENVKKLLPNVKNPNVRTYALIDLALFNRDDSGIAQLERLEEIGATITPQSSFWAKSTFIMILNGYILGHKEYENDYILFLIYYAHSMEKMPANYNLNFNIGRAYLELADFFQKKGKLNLAQKYMDTTMIYAGRSKIDAITYEVQSHIYESKGDLPQAIVFIKKALETYRVDYINRNNEVAFKNERRLYTQEKELKLALIDKENKEKAILLWVMGIGASLLAILLGIVFRQNRKAKKANELISKQTNELVVLMKEAHHRVKNNLQMVSAILYMQANTSKDKEAIDALLNAEGRLKTIALVHESLYKSENIAQINLNEYLSELLNNLAKQNNPSFDFVINTPDILITNIDTAIPIGLIVNELVTNSVKYAFNNRERGSIEISLLYSAYNGNLMKYRDNGKGFVGGKLPDAKSSLGIRLIKIFVQQLKGSLEYDQTNGVEFRLKFKNISSVGY